MELVIDANVLFSALIKESFSYNILFSGKFHLFAPEYIFTELEKHKGEIMNKTGRTTEELFRLVEMKKVTLYIYNLFFLYGIGNKKSIKRNIKIRC